MTRLMSVTVLSRIRLATRMPSRRRPLVLLTSLVLVGLLVSLAHASDASPFDHGDCPVCQSFHQALLAIPVVVTIHIDVIAVLQTALVACPASGDHLPYQGRAPPFSIFA
jgi:hypothetical protein